MSIQDKVLLRKIKKREKQKLKILQLKEAEKKEKEQNGVEQEIKNLQAKGEKRIHDDQAGPSKKKEKEEQEG